MSANRISTRLLIPALLGLGALACADEAADRGENQRAKVAQLERQVASLRESYALARADAEEARRQLREIRARLEALGGAAALGSSEERIIDTAARLETVTAELARLRQSCMRLQASVNSYTQKVLMEDAAVRQELDNSLRDLDLALGLRQTPQNELAGSLDESTVLSIDSESGLIVINAGREAKVEVGMPMLISRGDQVIAKAVVTDVRKKVAGMLVRKHLNPGLLVSVGDRVTLTTND